MSKQTTFDFEDQNKDADLLKGLFEKSDRILVKNFPTMTETGRALKTSTKRASTYHISNEMVASFPLLRKRIVETQIWQLFMSSTLKRGGRRFLKKRMLT